MLIETPVFNGQMTQEGRAAAQRDHLAQIEEALKRFPIDLVHFHGLDFHTYVPRNGVRKLATLHLPPAWYPETIFHAKDLNLNCVSELQAQSAPIREHLPVVSNGIETERYRPRPGAKEFLLWLGRICPEKGVHIALEVAHQVELPIVVAGPVHPYREHQEYFSTRVQPLLDGKRTYAGPVGLEQKAELLATARCLLIPSLVAETSSLVAMEAISSGTPVIAFRSGALPEVVTHGMTGFIVDSQEEMREAIARTGDISPEVCRRTAQERFDARRMVGDYLNLYASL